MADHVINIAAGGSASCMHTDAMPLTFLGDMTVRRASEILFDSSTQKWRIHLEDSLGAWVPLEGKSFDKYDDARKEEVLLLNYCMIHDADPFQVYGTGVHLKGM